MTRASVTLDETHEDILEDLGERRDIDSRAEAVRVCIEEHPRITELESDLRERDARVNELESQLMQANSRIDAANADTERADELVRVIDRERSLEERKARANWFTRQKWRLLGVPDDEG